MTFEFAEDGPPKNATTPAKLGRVVTVTLTYLLGTKSSYTVRKIIQISWGILRM